MDQKTRTAAIVLAGGALVGLIAWRVSAALSEARNSDDTEQPLDENGEPVPALPWAANAVTFGSDESYLASTVGKHWVLTNKLVGRTAARTAANYGMHFRGPSFDGKTWEASVSSYTQRVVQGIGLRHNDQHTDYSQTLVLVSQFCMYNGEPRLLSELLVDPVASKYLSTEGPLVMTRQAGVVDTGVRAAPAGDKRVSREDVIALMTPAEAAWVAKYPNIPAVQKPGVMPSWTQCPAPTPQQLMDREATYLSWVEAGMGEYEYVQLDVGPITISVFSDALRFGGVRIAVSAVLSQQIADRLDCSLLTPRIADIIYASATRVIQPKTMDINSLISGTLVESDRIEAAIQKASQS